MATILCLHDDPTLSRMLADALQRAGFEAPTIVVADHGSIDRLRRLADGNGAAAQAEDAVVLTSLNVDEAEARLIERALQVANGNRTRAAGLLGISVRTLRNKLNGKKPEILE